MPGRRTGGRPSKINDVLRTRDDGTEVTVADHIVEVLRAGGYVEYAAASAGIHKSSVYEWRRVAVEARKKPVRDRTAHEQRCVSFSDAVDEAESRWLVDSDVLLEQLARGGRTIEHRIEKRDGDGNVVETTVRTETVGANAAVAMWRRERKDPDRYGRRRLEVSGPDGGPIEVESPRDRLERRLREMHERQDEAADAVARARHDGTAAGPPDELEPDDGTLAGPPMEEERGD